MSVPPTWHERLPKFSPFALGGTTLALGVATIAIASAPAVAGDLGAFTFNGTLDASEIANGVAFSPWQRIDASGSSTPWSATPTFVSGETEGDAALQEGPWANNVAGAPLQAWQFSIVPTTPDTVNLSSLTLSIKRAGDITPPPSIYAEASGDNGATWTALSPVSIQTGGSGWSSLTMNFNNVSFAAPQAIRLYGVGEAAGSALELDRVAIQGSVGRSDPSPSAAAAAEVPESRGSIALLILGGLGIGSSIARSRKSKSITEETGH